MSIKNAFLKSAKLAIAGTVLLSGLAACKATEKHACASKGACASKDGSSKEKAKCSSKEKAKCSSKAKEKAAKETKKESK